MRSTNARRSRRRKNRTPEQTIAVIFRAIEVGKRKNIKRIVRRLNQLPPASMNHLTDLISA